MFERLRKAIDDDRHTLLVNQTEAALLSGISVQSFIKWNIPRHSEARGEVLYEWELLREHLLRRAAEKVRRREEEANRAAFETLDRIAARLSRKEQLR